jgi:hypothetical protein
MKSSMHVLAGTAYRVVLLALALVMAGSGHLPTFRLIQVGLSAGVLQIGYTRLQ